MVITERGSKLRISREELLNALVYPGMEGVRLGLVDAIGSDTDAIEKAADLAHVSGYDLVDVNTEVFRIFSQKLARILEPLFDLEADQGRSVLAGLMAPSRVPANTGDASQPLLGSAGLGMVRNLFLPSGEEQLRRAVPPDFPMEIDKPRIYYLYVGPY
jgi:ClpP class serine protease